MDSSIINQAREQINIALEDLAKKRSKDKEECRENVGQGNTGFLEESIKKIDAEFYSASIHSTWKILKEVVDNHKVLYSKKLEVELKDFAHSFWLREPAESPEIVKTAWVSALRKIDSEICGYVQTKKENNDEKEYNILNEEFSTIQDDVGKNQTYRCLVIMPIGKKETVQYKNNMAVFHKIIKPCVENSGYNFTCYHADLIDESGNISKQIFEGLRDDDLVIGDFRRKNVNMSYELGVRHALGKRTILVCSNFSENIFHSEQYRAIQYHIDGKSNQEFYKKLRKQIEEVVENPKKSDNPVIDMLGQGHLAIGNDDGLDKNLTFDEKLNVYVNEGGNRFCPGCYDKDYSTVRVVKDDSYRYKCPVCKEKYIDSYKEEAEDRKRREFIAKQRGTRWV